MPDRNERPKPASAKTTQNLYSQPPWSMSTNPSASRTSEAGMKARRETASTSLANFASCAGSLALMIRSASSWIITPPPTHTIAARTWSAFHVWYQVPFQAAKAMKPPTKMPSERTVASSRRLLRAGADAVACDSTARSYRRSSRKPSTGGRDRISSATRCAAMAYDSSARTRSTARPIVSTDATTPAPTIPARAALKGWSAKQRDDDERPAGGPGRRASSPSLRGRGRGRRAPARPPAAPTARRGRWPVPHPARARVQR